VILLERGQNVGRGQSAANKEGGGDSQLLTLHGRELVGVLEDTSEGSLLEGLLQVFVPRIHPRQLSCSLAYRIQDVPAQELVEHLDNLLDVGHLDGLLGGPNDGEGRLRGTVVQESTSGRQQSTYEEDLEEFLLILAVVELCDPGTSARSWRGEQNATNLVS
jgi:hypothetical protein